MHNPDYNDYAKSHVTIEQDLEPEGPLKMRAQHLIKLGLKAYMKNIDSNQNLCLENCFKNKGK